MKHNMLSADDLSRYARQIAIDGIGQDGQRKISDGKVLIIGCGALGSIVAMYLAGAGVGSLLLADFDTVDISNLQRQIFFTEMDGGKKKVTLLASAIHRLNSSVSVRVIDGMITMKNGRKPVSEVDFVIDATDNPASKYMTDRLCKELSKPCCIGGVEGFRGQLLTILPGDIRYEELFPEMPEDPGMTPCSLSGVIGPAAGVIASLQSAEALKFLSQAGELCRNRLMAFDLRTFDFSVFKI